MAKSQIIKILRSFIYVLRNEGIIVEKVFLYGSYLTGNTTNESDIDVMIVIENGNDDHLAGRIWNLTKKVSTKIEPFIIESKRFHSDDISPLVDLIKKTGLEIV